MEYVHELIDDIASGVRAERHLDTVAEAYELARAEASTISLAQRCVASVGREVTVEFDSGESCELTVDECADTWVRGSTPRGVIVVSLPRVRCMYGLASTGIGQSGSTRRRSLSLAGVIRDTADKYREVECHMADGVIRGRIVQVGHDWLDVVGPSSRAGAGRGEGKGPCATLAMAHLRFLAMQRRF